MEEIMSFDADDLGTLLDAKIDPLKEAIAKLEQNQERMVNVLVEQARTEQSVRHLSSEVSKCERKFDDVYKQIRQMKKAGETRLWEVVKLLAIAGSGAAIVEGVIRGLGG